MEENTLVAGTSASEPITLTADISEQVNDLEAKRQLWLQDKADILLASDNKKELVVSLIEDFNRVLNGSKQIVKIAKDSVNRQTLSGLRSALVEILQLFDPEYQYEVQ